MKLNFIGTFAFIVFNFLNIGNAVANKIDSLHTKQDVQIFLSDNFAERGIIWASVFHEISRDEKIRMFLSELDSVEVLDPVTHEIVINPMPRDSSSLSFFDTFRQNRSLSYDRITKLIMNRYPYHFYKADIDGNGYTDLVIDAGWLMVVMDNGGIYQGYMFAQLAALSFKKFIYLPDGSIGLLIQHDHNLCWRLDIAQDEIEIIDTIIDNTVSPPIVKTEKLGSYVTSSKLGAQCNKLDTIVYKYRGFAKYNSDVKPLNISRISYQYEISAGLVNDGVDCIEINKSGRCYLRYSRYNQVLHANLDKARLNDLWKLVGYIKIKDLKNDYSTYYDHGTGGVLSIYFEDGTLKQITFWGEHSVPLGLGYLSKSIADISRDLHWQKSADNADMECTSDRHTNQVYDKSNDCKCEW